MPLDREPNPGGNTVLVLAPDYALLGGLLAVPVDLLPPPSGVRYMPHLATCPNAEEFRK